MRRREFVIKGCAIAAGLVLVQGCSGEKPTTPQFPVSIVNAACTGCGICVEACPHHAISMSNNIENQGQGRGQGQGQGGCLPVIDQNLCTKCLTCIPECPDEAIIFQGF